MHGILRFLGLTSKLVSICYIVYECMCQLLQSCFPTFLIALCFVQFPDEGFHEETETVEVKVCITLAQTQLVLKFKFLVAIF